MKKIMGLVVVFTGLAIGCLAQQTPRVDSHQHVQRARIYEGRRDGDLTRHELRRLKAEQWHIRRFERRAKADGVTAIERRDLHRKQHIASRDIRRQRHDRQVRPE